MTSKRPREDDEHPDSHVSDRLMFSDDSDDEQPALLVRPTTNGSAFLPATTDTAVVVLDPSVPLVDIDDDDNKSLLEQRLLALLQECPTSYAGGSSQAETSPVMSYLLRTYCGIDAGTLRCGQEEVVRRILRRESVMALFPTGWGKSLCYQLPMLVHRLLNAFDKKSGADCCNTRQRFAVIVSPLLALISDQLTSIRRQDAVCAASISSTTGRDAEQKILMSLANPAGNDIDILLVSPEAFVTKHRLRAVLKETFDRIAFVCIDEAHCISSWSHDFRPTYLYLKKSLEDLHRQAQQHRSQHFVGDAGSEEPSLTAPPILALTATASSAVITEVSALLGIQFVVNRMTPRQNISLESIKLKAVETGGLGQDRTLDMRKEVMAAIRDLQTPMLIYAQTQVHVDELTKFLQHELSSEVIRGEAVSASPFRIAAYHAGLPLSQRTAAQRKFLTNEVNILVATVAFGMGINKSNIRSVVHYCCPASLAAYSQETGRAGRDGLPSKCRVIFDIDEFFSLRRKALTHMLSFSDVKKITSRIVSGNHVSTVGSQRTLAVSTEQIAGEVGCSTATVETLMYLILNSHPRVISALEGKAPLSFRVQRSAESTTDETATAAAVEDSSSHIRGWAHQRNQDQARRYGASMQGFLAQLGVQCPVEQLCRESIKGTVPSIIHAANTAHLPLDEFLLRVKSLEDSKAFVLRWQDYGFLIQCGPQFPPCEEMITLIAKEMYQKLQARMTSGVKLLHQMFEFLEAPSQESMIRALCGDEESTSSSPAQTTLALWTPPRPRLLALQAVDIANQFVSQNRERLLSATEAVKALMGIAPIISGSTSAGADAGLVPLTGSWYLRHPHFGALQEFDHVWLSKVVAAHALPA